MQWTDITDIAIELLETHPDVDPLSINFVDLRSWVMALQGFDDESSRCGERILEAIQAAWIEELE
ncbi:MAG: Fe-S cluster assembly protein IscX [Halioglobus sp.]|nr:Fe-S cluster assembly protein IscX [Halioglobus sp.]